MKGEGVNGHGILSRRIKATIINKYIIRQIELKADINLDEWFRLVSAMGDDTPIR